MVGIFDSGMGGLLALAELRRIMPDADVAFFADRRNAPYGTKSREQIVSLAKRDIDILRAFGAEDILVACCTASTVYEDLPDGYRRGVIPIIDATAYAAVAASESKRIGVLATEATVRSGAFSSAIGRFCKRAFVRCLARQDLVYAVERGADADASLEDALRLFGDVDTVILGCTHFAAFEEKIKKKGFTAVNSARIGAEMLSERASSGKALTLYINE